MISDFYLLFKTCCLSHILFLQLVGFFPPQSYKVLLVYLAQDLLNKHCMCVGADAVRKDSGSFFIQVQNKIKQKPPKHFISLLNYFDAFTKNQSLITPCPSNLHDNHYVKSTLSVSINLIMSSSYDHYKGCSDGRSIMSQSSFFTRQRRPVNGSLG